MEPASARPLLPRTDEHLRRPRQHLFPVQPTLRIARDRPSSPTRAAVRRSNGSTPALPPTLLRPAVGQDRDHRLSPPTMVASQREDLPAAVEKRRPFFCSPSAAATSCSGPQLSWGPDKLPGGLVDLETVRPEDGPPRDRQPSRSRVDLGFRSRVPSAASRTTAAAPYRSAAACPAALAVPLGHCKHGVDGSRASAPQPDRPNYLCTAPLLPKNAWAPPTHLITPSPHRPPPTARA